MRAAVSQFAMPPLPEAEATPTDPDAYDDIPVETSGEDCPPPVEKFADIALHPGLQANIDAAKFVKPTPVQRHSLSIGIARRDVMACAQTGSGKTGGFLFPVLHQMLIEIDARTEPEERIGRSEPRDAARGGGASNAPPPPSRRPPSVSGPPAPWAGSGPGSGRTAGGRCCGGAPPG